MLTDDTCISGEDLGSLSSTPPPPAAKRMRLSITRVEVTRKGKRQAFILPQMAQRFRSGDTSSSSTDMQGLFYASSPDRFSTNLLNKNSSSNSSSILLPLILPLQAGVPSPSAVPPPSSSPSHSAIALPSSSPSPSPFALRNYSPSSSRSPSRGPSLGS